MTLKVAALACTGCIGLLAAVAAHSDRDEAWLHRAELPPDAGPLLVLLLDTSVAATETITAVAAYDAARDYGAEIPAAGRCDPTRIYWRRGPGPAPDCAMQVGLAAAGDGRERGFHCDAARTALAQNGYFVASRAAQWQGMGGWRAPKESAAGAVECRADRGRHGAAAGDWYAVEDGVGPWSADSSAEIRWDRPPLADPYIFYHGNYLNYLRAAPGQRELALASLARESLATALRSTDGLAAALLLFHGGAEADGGYVRLAAASTVSIAATVEATAQADAPRSAPLGELLSEAAAWLTGAAVRFGNGPEADTNAFDATGTGYRSPYSHACRPLTLAIATAGRNSGDDRAAEAAAALPGFASDGDGCNGDCVGALAAYLQSGDLRVSTPGHQHAQLLWIAPGARLNDVVASAGGSKVAPAEDAQAYVNLIARAHQFDAAVPAGPSLSSAGLLAATPTTHVPAVYYALSAPRARERWLGNLYRYGLRAQELPLLPPLIVDRDGEPAIDPASGLPLPGSRSDWSDGPDANLLAGGAAGRLPAPVARRLFTEVATADITDPRNRLEPRNERISHSILGLGALDRESSEDAIGWLLVAQPIGDPGLLAPVTVNFRAQERSIAFVATQDGLLHAFDADSGVERWAWMPQALLPRLARLMRDEPTTARSHGIDGRLVVHRFDANGDGRIDAAAGEHLWLLFGLGRGGERLYALDIAEPDAPRLMWSHMPFQSSPAASAAGPVVARLATGHPGQSAGGWVVMLAAGRTLQMLDASTGAVLWSAGDAASDLPMRGLSGTFDSAPRLADVDGDGHVDRAYAIDSAGGLWRFLFTRDAMPAEFASTHRLARLGEGLRYFQSSPDISVARIHGRNEIAIAVGSGRLDRPRQSAGFDRAYVVFDRENAAEVAEPDLHNATDGSTAMPAGAPGWYVTLERHGEGERVAGSPLTFDHVLRFQTYQPLPSRGDEPCGPPRAVHRRYALDIRSGRPASTVEDSAEDQELEVEAAGFPSELRYAFPAAADSACAGCRPRAFGIAGPRTFDAGYAGDPVRTSWRNLPLPASP